MPALTALCYLGAFKLLGLRLRPERMQKSPLALEFEEAYLSTSFTDWTRRKPQGNRGSQCKKSQQQQQQARLKNSHAVCYLNACSQALCWLGMLTAAPQACFGLAQAAFKPLLHAGRPYLPSCLPWRPLLRGWRALSSQHDVCEFMAHLLSIAEPSAYEGLWQSRLTNPFLVTAAGPLAAPILLPITGSSLQALVDSWSQQASHTGSYPAFRSCDAAT